MVALLLAGQPSRVGAILSESLLLHEPLAAKLASMPARERQMFYLNMTPKEWEALRWDWTAWARQGQLEPPGDWSVWLLMAGRGYGKTRAGAEWVRSQMCGPTPLSPGKVRHMALVAETAADARDVMVKSSLGGILAVHPPDFRPTFVEGRRILEWPNGAIAHTYSAEDPEQLRGPEHDAAWSDELGKWRYADDTWDMLQFGLRLGTNPRQLVTTTPRPIPLIRELLKGEASGDTAVTRGSTYDNADNLAAKFLRKMNERYEGTRLGRQELHAELLDDVPGALWTSAMLDRRSDQNPKGAGMRPGEALPDMRRVVIGVDPSGSAGEAHDRKKNSEDDRDGANDDIGIIAAGLGVDGDVYVLQDATCQEGPAGWARQVVNTFDRQMADMVVGEANFGGAMVEYTIRTARRNIPYRAVHASRGKVVRAEPIAALYEQGRVRHVGSLTRLEDQMKNMTSSGYVGSRSPDRVDALVWAITDLVFGKSARGGSGTIGGHH